MDLSLFIADLLKKNNCVIVPGFGGFITNYKPAVIDELRQKIYPPSKSILFNFNLINNDGLLANYVSNKINKTYSESINLIQDVSNDWKVKLSKGERISIDEIGFLYEDKGLIQFEQNREFNVLLSAYGLSSVNFVSIESIENKEVATVDSTTVIEIGAVQHVETNDEKEAIVIALVPEVKTKSNRWKYIAVACFLPALFYSYWIPMETHYLDSGNVQMADFNPLHKKASKIYNTRNEKNTTKNSEVNISFSELIKDLNTTVKYYNYKFSDEIYIPVELLTQPVKIDKTLVSLETNTVVELAVSENKFHLIAGCFGNKSNAIGLVDSFKEQGYSAKIVDNNKGLYRVAIQSFASKNKAVSFKDELNSKSISTWLLSK